MKESKNVKFHFVDSVVVVTGAASGIGQETAWGFDGAGAQLVLLDVNEAGLQFERQIGKQVLFFPTDVSSPNDVAGAIDVAVKRFGRIDILVNCAAIEFNDAGNLVTMPFDKLKRVLDVNLYGYINMARACVPHMGSGGRIINVSSLQGLAAELPGTSYQVAKAGIFGITHALAVELAPKGITVNTVTPGSIKTAGMGNVRTGEVGLTPYRRLIPLGRRGWPEEVAATILFLASDAASYITGANLVVDGGRIVNITPDKPGVRTPANVPDDPDCE